MNALLSLSRIIDGINERVGKTTMWLILIVVVISAGNAVYRYVLNDSSNGLLEIQWYLFSAVFLLMAGYVFKRNEHIRIDIIAGRLSARSQNWIDVFGIVVFMLPMVILTMTLSWPVFMNAWVSNETSPNPGGLDPLAGAPADADRLLPAAAAGALRTHQAHRLPDRERPQSAGQGQGTDRRGTAGCGNQAPTRDRRGRRRGEQPGGRPRPAGGQK